MILSTLLGFRPIVGVCISNLKLPMQMVCPHQRFRPLVGVCISNQSHDSPNNINTLCNVSVPLSEFVFLILIYFIGICLFIVSVPLSEFVFLIKEQNAIHKQELTGFRPLVGVCISNLYIDEMSKPEIYSSFPSPCRSLYF